MQDYDEIDIELGIPKEMVSCPGCGYKYGYRNTKVCVECEECSKCCSCEHPMLITASEMIKRIV